MVSEDRDPESPYYDPNADHMGTDSGEMSSSDPEEAEAHVFQPIYRGGQGYPHTEYVRQTTARRGLPPQRATFVAPATGLSWDLPSAPLRMPISIRDKFFLTSVGIGTELSCHMVQNLAHAFCKGDGCIPCLVVHAMLTQTRYATCHMRTVIYKWHQVLRPYGSQFLAVAPILNDVQDPQKLKPIFYVLADLLRELRPEDLALLATNGGVRITARELVTLARTGALMDTIGTLGPLHLTCRRLDTQGDIGIQFTADFCPAILTAWLAEETETLRWPILGGLEHQTELMARVAKAIMGFLRLTLEDHLSPTFGPGTYIPKSVASAMWEHIETAIRLISPCPGCVMMGRHRGQCPTALPGCVLGGTESGPRS